MLRRTMALRLRSTLWTHFFSGVLVLAVCLAGFDAEAQRRGRGKRQREQRHGPVKENRIFLAPSVFVPFTRALGPPLVGYGVGGGAFIDLLTAALQPRLVFHYGGGSRDSHFFHLQGDLGAMWMADKGDISPMLGGGLGLAYVNRRSPTETVTRGSVVEMTSRTVTYVNAFGVTGYARGGAMFLRRSKVSLQVTLDLSVSAMGELGFPVGAMFGVGVML